MDEDFFYKKMKVKTHFVWLKILIFPCMKLKHPIISFKISKFQAIGVIQRQSFCESLDEEEMPPSISWDSGHVSKRLQSAVICEVSLIWDFVFRMKVNSCPLC